MWIPLRGARSVFIDGSRVHNHDIFFNKKMLYTIRWLDVHVLPESQLPARKSSYTIPTEARSYVWSFIPQSLQKMLQLKLVMGVRIRTAQNSKHRVYEKMAIQAARKTKKITLKSTAGINKI